MDVADWIMNEFTDGLTPPHWKCPICNYGIVVPIKENFHLAETAASLKRKGRESPFYADYVFSGILKCNSNSCGEVVSFSGIAYDSDFERQVGEEDYETVDFIRYESRYFYPTLHLFHIPNRCPADITKQIRKAFSLYFNDYSSCVNNIRVAIELMLTHQGVRRNKIALHDRIVLFKKGKAEFDEIRSRLLAIKWIGNDGSHGAKRLKSIDVLSAFELLENVIEKLYGDKEARMKWTTKLVNKKRGIVPKRKVLPKWLKKAML